jgi:hypothetical protein
LRLLSHRPAKHGCEVVEEFGKASRKLQSFGPATPIQLIDLSLLRAGGSHPPSRQPTLELSIMSIAARSSTVSHLTSGIGVSAHQT